MNKNIELPEPEQNLKPFLCKLVSSQFDRFDTLIRAIKVHLLASNDQRVPYKTVFEIILEGGGHTIKTEAVSVNYISAFSQAMSRAEKKFLKLNVAA